MLDHLSNTIKHWLDVGAIAGAVVAGISLANLAFVTTIIAGIISSILGLIRIYDWAWNGKDA